MGGWVVYVAWRGVAWRGVAWRGVAWRGVAWRGVAWRGVAWRGVAWRGVASCVRVCMCIIYQYFHYNKRRIKKCSLSTTCFHFPQLCLRPNSGI